MNAPTNPDVYGTLIEPTTLKIQRMLPGPIERVWAYLTDSELRRKWLAAGAMEMQVGAPFEFVWRNDELSNPPGKRPEGFPDEHRMQSRITELDPLRKISFTWNNSGDVTFELEPRGERVLLTADPSPSAGPRHHAQGRTRLARASRRSRRPGIRPGAAAAILGPLAQPAEGL